MSKFKVGDSAIIADENSWYFDRECKIVATTVYDELVIHTVEVKLTTTGNASFAVRESELKEVVGEADGCCGCGKPLGLDGECVSCYDPCFEA